MANSVDPDQLASKTDLDLHCLQRQGISGFSITKINPALSWENESFFHHCADYVCISLGIIWGYSGYFEMEYRWSRATVGVGWESVCSLANYKALYEET